jgi:hypothetical protein
MNFYLKCCILLAAIITVSVMIKTYINNSIEDKNKNYLELVSKNNCYIYQVLEHPNGTVEKYWTCNNQSD